ELSHIRHRDNLMATLHMLVETVFWFHPLVWWLSNRLVDEREKACDEDVLRWGGAPTAYAEGILKVCEFCLESSFIGAAGVTGSDLKKRIEKIMRNRTILKLSVTRLALIAVVAVLALVSPIAIGMVKPPGDKAPPTASDKNAVEFSNTSETAAAPQPANA